MDEHILLDLVANSQIVIKGIQYGIFAQDIDVTRLQQEQLNDYGKLRHKASTELNGHMFDRPFDAAKALDIGIKGERIVMEGMINLQFVQDIMNVLVEEIKDSDVLHRIAFKLKTLIQTQDNNGN